MRPAGAISLRGVAVGASAGGMEALSIVLRALPCDWPLFMLVVLHLHRNSSGAFAQALDRACALPVRVAEDKVPAGRGEVWCAPANYHLLVERDATLSLSVDPPVNFARPSVDVLFESAAEAFGSALAGVVLTGGNFDGARGLAAIKAAGGIAIVQDPATAAVPAMPLAALEATGVDAVLSLAELAAWLRGCRG